MVTEARVMNALTESVDEVLAELDESTEVVQIDYRHVGLGEGGSLMIDGKHLTDLAHQQLVSILKYPYSFCKKCTTSELVNDIRKYCIDKSEARDVKVLTIRNEVYAVVCNDSPLVRLSDILKTVKDIDPNIRIQNITESHINFVTQMSVSPSADIGDASNIGFNILFNNRGMDVSGLMYRLTNESVMLSPKKFSCKYVKGSSDTEALGLFKNIVIDVVEMVRTKLAPLYIKIVDVEIKQPMEFVEALAAHFKLSTGIRKDASAKMLELKAPVMAYDIVNIITATGSTIAADDLKKAFKFQMFGGFIVHSFGEKRCATCKNLV